MIDKSKENFEDRSLRGIDPRIFEIEDSLGSMLDQEILTIFEKSPAHIDIIKTAYNLNRKLGGDREVMLEELAKRKSNDPENENFLQVLIDYASMKPETIKRLYDVVSSIEAE